MDVNTLLEHVSLMEAQNRNEETARIEEEALHRETKSQLHAGMGNDMALSKLKPAPSARTTHLDAGTRETTGREKC